VKRAVSSIIAILFLFLTVAAQNPSQLGDSNSDLRDDNIRLRSIELERIKREASKRPDGSDGTAARINFELVKKDFEKLQKKYSDIIETYNKFARGGKLDYDKLEKYSAEIVASGLRLDSNLFAPKEDETPNNEMPEIEIEDQNGVRELIVKLDEAVGRFIMNPIFHDNLTVDQESTKNAQTDLRLIIVVSQRLSTRSASLK
jgi:hypothetical protein